MDCTVKLTLDLIEQVYVAWDVDCCAQPPNELERRAVKFLIENEKYVTGQNSLSAIKHEREMGRLA